MEPRRIMMVDDEISFTHLAKLNLEKSGKYALCVENDRRGKRLLQQIRGTWLILRSQVRLSAGIVCADWGCSKCRRRSGGSRSCVSRCWEGPVVVVVVVVSGPRPRSSHRPPAVLAATPGGRWFRWFALLPRPPWRVSARGGARGSQAVNEPHEAPTT